MKYSELMALVGSFLLRGFVWEGGGDLVHGDRGDKQTKSIGLGK